MSITIKDLRKSGEPVVVAGQGGARRLDKVEPKAPVKYLLLGVWNIEAKKDGARQHTTPNYTADFEITPEGHDKTYGPMDIVELDSGLAGVLSKHFILVPWAEDLAERLVEPTE